MHVRHSTPAGICTGSNHEPAALFLRGSQSWFHIFSATRATRYEGFFITNEQDTPHRYWKFLERVVPTSGEEPLSATIADTTAHLRYATGTLSFAIGTTVEQRHSFSVESSCELSLTFDMRGIYQYPTTDRHYTTIQKSGGWILQYTDPLLDTTIFLAYRGPQELPDYTWEEAFYPRDSARFSPPHSLWVCVQKLQPGTHHFGAGFSADAAWEAACNAPTPQAQALEGSVITASEAAIYAAKRTLAVLKTPAGIYAGFPWFHQVWSRDELIALLGLPSDQQIAGIERYLTLTPQSGRLPTYIGSGTTCADGLGWLALVCREAADNCNTDLKTRITEYFQTALTDLIASHTDPKTGLITSGHNETWMDTIGREGCCVEIQAMAILVSELIDEWSNQSNWESWRAEMRSNIATWLVSDNVLADRTTPEGVRDDAVRPNVLLALLIDRNLVPRSTWDRTIELVLESCTTMWGGLSSLSQLHPAYMATSTGESNTSYHQGDSWLMMDGLSATALLRYNRELFGDIAKSIIRASTEEILWRHILGYVGEIRAAGDGGSWGTGVQAFSAGAYLLATAELQK